MISEATRKRIEEGLKHWHDPDSPERLRFEAARRVLDKKYQYITDAVVASERITAADLSIVINTLP